MNRHRDRRDQHGVRWKARAALVTAAICAGLLALVGCQEAPPSSAAQLDRGPADPGNRALVARGERVYQQHCASCHGVDLEGQPNWREPRVDGLYSAPPHDATGHTHRHSDDQLFDVTRNGTPNLSAMPAFVGILSDAEIWSSLAYIKSRWPPALVARQRLVTRARSAGHHRHAAVVATAHAVDDDPKGESR